MRLFFAVWPPPQTARALAQWAVDAQTVTGGRATAKANIHLTLAFLGEAGPERALRAAATVEARVHELPIEKSHYWRESNIVWVGPHQTPAALKALQERLAMAPYREEFIVERRPFAAHVTLLRKARAAALPPVPAVKWPVREFLLVGSKVSSRGSTYETVERFSLRA